MPARVHTARSKTLGDPASRKAHGPGPHPPHIYEISSLRLSGSVKHPTRLACVQEPAESNEKQEGVEQENASVMNSATESGAAQKQEAIPGIKDKDTKETGARDGGSLGLTRDGKSLPVRVTKETRAWEGPAPVRRNRKDRPRPEWADPEEEVVEQLLLMRAKAPRTKGPDEETKQVAAKIQDQPAAPGGQTADKEVTGDEEAVDGPSIFVDVPLSPPTSDDHELAKGFMAAEEIAAAAASAAAAAPVANEKGSEKRPTNASEEGHAQNKQLL